MDPKQAVFNKVKKVMKKYEKYFTANIDMDGNYSLISQKDLIIDGKKRGNLWFAGIIIQKNFVGFYFQPIYARREDIIDAFKPELLSLQKGKSSFHLLKVNRELLKQIDLVLQRGRDLFEDNDWI